MFNYMFIPIALFSISTFHYPYYSSVGVLVSTLGESSAWGALWNKLDTTLQQIRYTDWSDGNGNVIILSSFCLKVFV